MNGQDPSASSNMTSQDPSLVNMVPNQNLSSSSVLTSTKILSSSILTSQYPSSNSILNNEVIEQSTPIVLASLDPLSINIGTSQVPSSLSAVSIQHPLSSGMSNPDNPSISIVTNQETSSTIVASEDPSTSSIETRKDPFSCGVGTIREQSFSFIVTNPDVLSSTIVASQNPIPSGFVTCPGPSSSSFVTCPGPSSSSFVTCPGPSSSSIMTSSGPSSFSAEIRQEPSSSSNTSSQVSYSYIAISDDSDTDESSLTLQRESFLRRYHFISDIIRNELYLEEFLEEKSKSCKKSSCATERQWKIQKELDDLLRLSKRNPNVRSFCVVFSVIKLYYVMRQTFSKTGKLLHLPLYHMLRFRINMFVAQGDIDQILSNNERNQNIVPLLQQYLFHKKLRLTISLERLRLAWERADTLVDNLFEKCNEADNLEKAKGLRKSICTISEELYRVLIKISQRSCDCMDEAREFHILRCYLLSKLWLN